MIYDIDIKGFSFGIANAKIQFRRIANPTKRELYFINCQLDNQNHIMFGWQPRFHDHIIRKTDEMNRIAEYIETNVLRWESDEFYS